MALDEGKRAAADRAEADHHDRAGYFTMDGPFVFRHFVADSFKYYRSGHADHARRTIEHCHDKEEGPNRHGSCLIGFPAFVCIAFVASSPRPGFPTLSAAGNPGFGLEVAKPDAG
jgi:hypothetical protein